MGKIIWIAVAIVLLGCTKKPSINDKCNSFDVVKIFEYDGVKVYRFYDGGTYIYFTNTNSKVEWETSRQNGKIITTEKNQVMCNKTY